MRKTFFKRKFLRFLFFIRKASGYKMLKAQLFALGKQQETNTCYLLETLNTSNQMMKTQLTQISSLSVCVDYQIEEVKNIRKELEYFKANSTKWEDINLLLEKIQKNMQKAKEHSAKLMVQQEEFHIKLSSVAEQQTINNQALEKKIDASNQTAKSQLTQISSLTSYITSQTAEIKNIDTKIKDLKINSIKKENLQAIHKDILKNKDYLNELMARQESFQGHAIQIEEYSKLILMNNIMEQADKILKSK